MIAERFAQAPPDESRYYATTYLRALAAQPGNLPARIARNFAAVAVRLFPAVATDYWCAPIARFSSILCRVRHAPVGGDRGRAHSSAAIVRREYGASLAGSFAVILVCALATDGWIAVVHAFEPRYLAMQAPMFVMLGFLATFANVDALSDGGLIGRLDAEK
jgi:hypothetical protein